MPRLAEAQKAMSDLNTKDVKGNKIVVNEARPKTNDRIGGGKRGGGGNRGGGGGGHRSGSSDGNRGFGNRW